MKPQTQKYQFGEGFGDCHRTCIAMILNMDRDSVPHFMIDLPPGTPADDLRSKDCTAAEIAWLAQFNLSLVSIPIIGSALLDDVIWQLQMTSHAPVILGCGTIAGNHSVVIHEGIVYNPHPALQITGPMADGFWWITIYSPNDNWGYAPLQAVPTFASVVKQED